MPHCPSCKSFASAGAVFCAQCGEQLQGRSRGRGKASAPGGRRRAALILVALAILAGIGLVVWIATLPEPASRERAVKRSPARSAAGAAAAGEKASAKRASD